MEGEDFYKNLLEKNLTVEYIKRIEEAIPPDVLIKIRTDFLMNSISTTSRADASSGANAEVSNDNSGNSGESSDEDSSDNDGPSPAKEAKVVTGFDRGLEAEKIITVSISRGKPMYLMKWVGLDEPELVLASEANIKCSEVVIKFYEDRLAYHAANPIPVIGKKLTRRRD